MKNCTPFGFAALLPIVLLAASCSALSSMRAAKPDVQYVQADRATYETIAPVITKLADTDATNDPDLTGVNGTSLLELLQTWDERIDAAEAGGGAQ